MDNETRKAVAASLISAAEKAGRGHSFLDGTRDVSLICINKRHAEYMAGMLKSNLSDVAIALWE